MPAKTLTLAQLKDAARLRQCFQIWKHAQESAGLPSTQQYAAEQLGFGQSALSQYLRGAIPLNMRVVMKLASVFGCAPEDISPTIAAEASRIADAAARHVSRMTAEDVKTSPEPASAATPSEARPREFPVISWAHAADWAADGDWRQDEPDDIWLAAPVDTSESSFYLRILSESMFDPRDAKSFGVGDLVLVDAVREPRNGSFVVVKLEESDEAVLRQLVFEGSKQFLKLLNPAWPDRVSPMHPDVLICGVVRAKVVHY
ncbi:helix-turn-helix domain-containing protein [Burkholderia plantarii]|uniref:S24 family peptidase n=1 Tax=Burkholderia plantarii TaxID=41899 RepID=UPI00272D3F12|nr:S24 family peptidase [Burkholderia plantarii]WLE58368.1 helix-turn-helix domain-containing protein [Burkholderia plantarii]